MFPIGTLLGAALSLGSAIVGGQASKKAAQNVKNNIEQQQRENQAWYDRRYNEDPLRRTSAQRVLERTQDMLRKRNKAAAGAAAVAGGTEESVAATKAASNEAMADAVSRIAAQDEARKDAIEQQYLGNKQVLQNQLNNLEMQRAQGIAGATQGAASSLGSLGLAIDDYRNSLGPQPQPQPPYNPYNYTPQYQ